MVLVLLAMGGLFYNRTIKKKRNIVAQEKRERDELEEAEALQTKEVHVKEIHEVDAPFHTRWQTMARSSNCEGPV